MSRLFVKVKHVKDLTTEISGTSAVWPFEVEEVFVDGVSTAFTYTVSTKTVDIPSYTSGRVEARGICYLTYGGSSIVADKDPTTPSDDTFWESRLRSYPEITRSIDNFETGRGEIFSSSIVMSLDDSWSRLTEDTVNFTNQQFQAFNNGSKFIDGVVVSNSISNGEISLNTQIRLRTLENECTFGDPQHLVRIDRSHSSSFYTGVNVPEKFSNYVIPMVFGTESPYEIKEGGTVGLGDVIGALALPPAQTVRMPTHNWALVLRAIPISQTEAILCKLPPFQTFALGTLDSAITSSTRLNEGATDAVAAHHSSKILGESLTFNISAGAGPYSSHTGRVNSIVGTAASIVLNVSDPTAAPTFNNSQSFGNVHILTDGEAIGGLNGSRVLTIDTTPNGNKLLKITASLFNFYKQDAWVVLTNIGGERSGPEVAQFILESHGLTVDAATFTGASVTQSTLQRVGADLDNPTVQDVLAELNRSMFSAINIPSDGSAIKFLEVNTDTPSVTLDEGQIGNLTVNEEGRLLANTVRFEPKYNKQETLRDTLAVDKVNGEAAEVYGVERTEEIEHVLSGTPARFDDIAEYYSKPLKKVDFELYDDQIALDLGDTITIDHNSFKGDLYVTRITMLDGKRRVLAQSLPF